MSQIQPSLHFIGAGVSELPVPCLHIGLKWFQSENEVGWYIWKEDEPYWFMFLSGHIPEYMRWALSNSESAKFRVPLGVDNLKCTCTYTWAQGLSVVDCCFLHQLNLVLFSLSPGTQRKKGIRLPRLHPLRFNYSNGREPNSYRPQRVQIPRQLTGEKCIAIHRWEIGTSATDNWANPIVSYPIISFSINLLIESYKSVTGRWYTPINYCRYKIRFNKCSGSAATEYFLRTSYSQNCICQMFTEVIIL